MFGSSQWALLTRKQQSDVLNESIISYVIDWWNNDMKVNPNQSDVEKKLIAPKVYEEHADICFLKHRSYIQFISIL
jgi:hypothetical protein